MHTSAALLATLLLAPACVVRTGGSPLSAPPSAPAVAPAATGGAPSIGCDQDIGAEFEQAVTLEVTSRTASCLQGDDVDAFRLVGPAVPGGTLVRYSADAERAHVSVRVHDGDRKQVSFTGGETATGWLHVAPGATVYLRIGTYGRPTSPYLLSLESHAVDEPAEPNDEPAAATPLVVGTPQKGILARPLGQREAAVDWYQFTAPASGKISAVVDVNVELQTQIALLDGNRRKLEVRDGNGGERVVIDAAVTPGQTYFVSVRPRYTVDAEGTGETPVRLERPYLVTVSSR